MQYAIWIFLAHEHYIGCRMVCSRGRETKMTMLLYTRALSIITVSLFTASNAVL